MISVNKSAYASCIGSYLLNYENNCHLIDSLKAFEIAQILIYYDGIRVLLQCLLLDKLKWSDVENYDSKISKCRYRYSILIFSITFFFSFSYLMEL